MLSGVYSGSDCSHEGHVVPVPSKLLICLIPNGDLNRGVYRGMSRNESIQLYVGVLIITIGTLSNECSIYSSESIVQIASH